MFCVKLTVELFSESASSGAWVEIWTQLLPWLCAIGSIGFAVSNVGFLAQGLKEQEAVFMVSVFTGSQIVAGFVSGVVVLDEFAAVSTQLFLIHCSAVAMVVAGI